MTDLIFVFVAGYAVHEIIAIIHGYRIMRRLSKEEQEQMDKLCGRKK